MFYAGHIHMQEFRAVAHLYSKNGFATVHIIITCILDAFGSSHGSSIATHFQQKSSL